MSEESLFPFLLGRGIPSVLAAKIASKFSTWEILSSTSQAELEAVFNLEEIKAIHRAKGRRGIPVATVNLLIERCYFRCCLCWNIDSEKGVIIHHIRLHATKPDDSYDNLVVLCSDHHGKVHTDWHITKHPFPPELLRRKKADFETAIASFRTGNRPAPGREKTSELGITSLPPFPKPSFTGRGTILKDICVKLENKGVRVALVGMGGVGKTELSIKCAEICREQFKGGVFWSDVNAAYGGAFGLTRTWIRALGHEGDGLEKMELLSLLRELLTERETQFGNTLLIIDDVDEQSLEDLMLISSYFPPPSTLLITTRDTAAATAMGALPIMLDPLEREDSLNLLKFISDHPHLDHDLHSCDILLSQIGDLPLAVELLAKQISTRQNKPGFTIKGLCERLKTFDHQLLSFPGHRGISLSFQLSYDSMTEFEQNLFRSLGAHAPGIHRSRDVAFVAGITEEEAQQSLDRMVTISVANWGEKADEYRLHPLIYKYAEFLLGLAQDNEKESVGSRFCHHYSTIAIEASKIQKSSTAELDKIFGNLVIAIRRASHRENDHLVVETMMTLCVKTSYFTLKNLDEELIELLNLAIKASERLCDDRAKSAFLGHKGTACARLGRISDAISNYESAINAARKVDENYDLASHLQNLATVLLNESADLQRALDNLNESIEVAKKANNLEALVGSFGTLGSLFRANGDSRQAAIHYQNALDGSKLSGNRHAIGTYLANLGLAHIDLGNLQKGESMIEESIAIAVEVGDKRGEGNRTGHLGRVLFLKAKDLPSSLERDMMLNRAEGYALVAIDSAKITKDPEKAAYALMNFAGIRYLRGSSAESIPILEEALKFAHKARALRAEGQIRLNLGSQLAKLGPDNDALSHLKIAADLLTKMRSPLADIAQIHHQKLLDTISIHNALKGKD